MAKQKPLLPTLRERKRYLSFEVLSEKPVAKLDVARALENAGHTLLGDLGMAAAGVWFIDEKWNAETQQGMLRVSAAELDKMKAVLTLVQRIRDQDVSIRSLFASGMIGKAG